LHWGTHLWEVGQDFFGFSACFKQLEDPFERHKPIRVLLFHQTAEENRKVLLKIDVFNVHLCRQMKSSAKGI
jgi:hypothetical protein